MKCGVRISKSELGDMFFYVIVNLISVIACEFAFASVSYTKLRAHETWNCI